MLRSGRKVKTELLTISASKASRIKNSFSPSPKNSENFRILYKEGSLLPSAPINCWREPWDTALIWKIKSISRQREETSKRSTFSSRKKSRRERVFFSSSWKADFLKASTSLGYFAGVSLWSEYPFCLSKILELCKKWNTLKTTVLVPNQNNGILCNPSNLWTRP